MGNYIPKYKRGHYWKRTEKEKIQVLKEAYLLEHIFKNLKKLLKKIPKLNN